MDAHNKTKHSLSINHFMISYSPFGVVDFIRDIAYHHEWLNR